LLRRVAGERELRLTEREYKEQLAELQAQVRGS
jgi:hypothetical protein